MPRYTFVVTDPSGRSECPFSGWHSTDESVAEFVYSGRVRGLTPGTRIRAWLAPIQEHNEPIEESDLTSAPIVDYTVR